MEEAKADKISREIGPFEYVCMLFYWALSRIQEVSLAAWAQVATCSVGDRQGTHQDGSQADTSSKDLCCCFLLIPSALFGCSFFPHTQ